MHMPRRRDLVLAVSLGLSLSLVSAHGELRAHAQDHPVYRAPCPRAEAPPAAQGPAPSGPAASPPSSPTQAAEAAIAPPAESAAPPPSADRPDTTGSRTAEVATAPPAEHEGPPASGASEAPESGARQPEEEQPLVALASAATRAEPPPAPSDALRALDDVLSGEPGDPLATIEPSESPAASVETPSREETRRAIERVLPSVRACVGDDAGGVVVLRLVFASSGRATAVLVQSQSARLTHAQRACIVRAARRAEVSAFQRPHFASSYPVRL
jgi:hypothetical protein